MYARPYIFTPDTPGSCNFFHSTYSTNVQGTSPRRRQNSPTNVCDLTLNDNWPSLKSSQAIRCVFCCPRIVLTTLIALPCLQLSHELPDIIQTFLRNGNACDKVLAKALQMGTQIQMQQNHSSNLQLHHDILDKLGEEFDGRSLPF